MRQILDSDALNEYISVLNDIKDTPRALEDEIVNSDESFAILHQERDELTRQLKKIKNELKAANDLMSDQKCGYTMKLKNTLYV